MPFLLISIKSLLIFLVLSGVLVHSLEMFPLTDMELVNEGVAPPWWPDKNAWATVWPHQSAGDAAELFSQGKISLTP